MSSKRDVALNLAEELLSDIELHRISPMDIARKTSRLARILNDTEAMFWLYYEVSGYPKGDDGLHQYAWKAAVKSHRIFKKDGKEYATTYGIGELETSIESAGLQLSAAADAPKQISSANPNQHVFAPAGNFIERDKLRKEMIDKRATLDKVVGSFHIYVASKYQELRFGAAAETAFDKIRDKVEKSINELVPDALPVLTTAMENASDDNPLQWGNAAKACRDLIKATADSLRPPGEPKNDREMTDAQYINRLMDWIETNSNSGTMRDIITSDLHDLGTRLDSLNDSGHKGAHTLRKVTQQDASRFVIGTYILLGDILDLRINLDKQVPDPVPLTSREENVDNKGQMLKPKTPNPVKPKKSRTKKTPSKGSNPSK